MSAVKPSVATILAITSSTAFLKVGRTLSIDHTISSLDSIGASSPLRIAASQSQSRALSEFLKNRDLQAEILICEPTAARSLAEAILPSCANFDAILIHDASRPFVSQGQFEAVQAAFNEETDAVRPGIAFTETLKILDADSVIKKTLDRSTVLQISTPELIRVSAIDLSAVDSGWFLPLKKGARTLHITGNPDGMRINTVEDRDLMELSTD